MTITGSEGDDQLTGTNSADTINGRLGNDIIIALDGDDVVSGGAGADIINGGNGNNSLYGYNYQEYYYDAPQAWDGSNDTILAGSGNDRILSVGGNNIDAGDGNNYIFEWNGYLSLGFSGNTHNTSNVYTSWGAYYWDLLNVGGSDDIPAPTIKTGSGNDFVAVYRGENIELGNGNDVLLVSAGTSNEAIQEYNGGAGYDKLIVTKTAIKENQYQLDFSKIKNFEELVLTTTDGSVPNVLNLGEYISDENKIGKILIAPRSFSGDYIIDGTRYGEHSLVVYTDFPASYATYPSVQFNGTEAADTFNGGYGKNLMTGGGGDDKMIGSIDTDTFTGGAGNDYFDGSDGVDTAVFTGDSSDYTITKIANNALAIKDNRVGSPDGRDTLVDVNLLRFSDKVTTVDYAGIPTTENYSVTQSSTVAEGATLTTNVATTAVAKDTTIYWSATGTGIDADDFTGGAQELTGQATVGTDGRFSFTHSIKNDNKTEGNETLQVKLYSDVARTLQVGSTASSTIKDSSTTPPTYSVTHSPSGTVEEGVTLTTTLQTTGVDEGATIYWTADGENIDEDDFSSGELSGEGTVDADGKVTISHNLANDEISEGDETLQFAFYSDEDHQTPVTRTSTVTVSDTSKTPPTYTISQSSPAINEGGTLNTTVRTTDLPAGTKIYWSAGGTGIDDNDFSEGELSGEGIVGEDGTFTFSHKLAHDNKTEGNETLQIKLYSSSDYTVQLGETESTKIFDTSRNSVIVTKQEGDAHAGINEDLPRGQSNVVGIRTRNLNVNGNGEFDSDVDSTSTAVATTGNGNASAHVRQSLLGISISDSSRIGGDGKFTSILTHDSDNSASAVNGTADVQDHLNSVGIDVSTLRVQGKSNFGSYMSVRSQNSADTTQTNDENISTNASATLNRNQLPSEPNIVGMRFDRLTLDNKGIFNSQVDNTSDMSANSIRGDASTFSNNSVLGIGFNGASRITGDAQVTSLLTQRSFSDAQSVHGTAITEDHHSVIGIEAHDLTVTGNASFSSTVVVRALSNSGT